MKLRISGNTLRLRLSRSDIALLSDAGLLEDSIQFGPGSDQRLVFGLITSTDHETLSILHEKGHIAVLVPKKAALEWVQTDRVGFDGEHPIGDGKVLKVTVEKDFQCLVARDEDDADAFPNPAAYDG
jgi:hypothetical protein